MRALGSLGDYVVEVTVTLAAAMATYALGERLGVSGPIAVVAAGLLVGHSGRGSETRRYVHGFWELVDEILNAVLFLLLGLEAAVVGFTFQSVAAAAVATALVLASRFAVIFPWGAYLARRHGEKGAVVLLGWGGLHGALSLALALTIPPGPARGLILSITFAVVVTSVVLQGLTYPWVTQRVSDRKSGA